MGGSGVTRIDAVYVNKSALALICGAAYMYDEALADHVPIEITFEVERFNAQLLKWIQPLEVPGDCSFLEPCDVEAIFQ